MAVNIRDRDDFYEKFFKYFNQLAECEKGTGIFSATLMQMKHLLDLYINSPISNSDGQKPLLFLLEKKIDVDSRNKISNEDMLVNLSRYVAKIHTTRQESIDTKPMTVVHIIRRGIQFVFVQCPALASIGTSEQYSAYLDSIYPESKIRDIVYFGTDRRFDGFGKGSKNDLTVVGSVGEGYYFSPDSYKHNSKHLIPVILNATHPLFDLKYNIFDFGHRRLEKESSDKIIINRYELYNGKVDIHDKFVEQVIFRIQNMKEISMDALSKIFTQVMQSLGFDSLTHHSKLFNGIEIVVFSPEQTYFLGTKQDIEGFKNYIAWLKSKANTRTGLIA